uniref:(northern house mosquito) hypothetical protein n=1 Tax=Culex pipiens TaxID=7175 RepID=A0A8D8HG89_CULPI
MNSRVQIAQHELFVPLWQGLRSGCRSRIDFLHRSLSFAATLPFIQLCLSQRGLLQVRVDRLRLCSLLRDRPALRNTSTARKVQQLQSFSAGALVYNCVISAKCVD